MGAQPHNSEKRTIDELTQRSPRAKQPTMDHIDAWNPANVAGRDNIISSSLILSRKLYAPNVRLATQNLIYGDRPDPLRRLATAPQAAFNAVEKGKDPLCLGGTRVRVLEQIRTWADGDDGRHIFWLSGRAGTGKSTIARTIARYYYGKNSFMASFFFSRGGDVNDARMFVGTIASQLAKRCDAFKSSLVKIISNDDGITDRMFSDQWDELVLNPLRTLKANSFRAPLLIVIDALDECEKGDAIKVLGLLSSFECLSGFTRRVFITSRPEISLQGSMHHGLVLDDISRTDVDNDIFLALKKNLADIERERQFTQNWPGDEIIKKLVERAAGLFLWADLASRHISDGGPLTRERLSSILQGIATRPEEALDEIYAKVLESSAGDNPNLQEKCEVYRRLKKTLGPIVILFSPLPSSSLAELLHIKEMEVKQTLLGLQSILDIPKDPSRPIRLHHPSLRDFLISPQKRRNEHFRVEENKVHKMLASHCIQLMSNKLQRDICGLGDPGARVVQVLHEKIACCLPAELQYACRYWVDHLQRSGYQQCDSGEVHCFLKHHLLHWMEALSLCKSMSEGVISMAKLEAFIQVILG